MTTAGTVSGDEADLHERAARAGVTCDRILHHTDKAIVATGSRDGRPVVAKLLTTADPYWVARREHELLVYRRFDLDPPPVRAPRLLWHDEQLAVLSHVPGDRLDDHRHLTAEPAADRVQQLLDTLDRIRRWSPAAELPAMLDYPGRLAADHDTGLLDRRDRAALERLLAAAGELTTAHGDPLPSNVLFDGERWGMVDWEHAGRYLPAYDLAVLYTIGAHAGPAVEQAIRARVTAAGTGAAFVVNAMLLCCREIRMHQALPPGSLRTARLGILADHQERVRALLHRTLPARH